MENNKKKTNFGRIGEGIARDYLINKGYLVLKMNYLKKFGEIDIIAIDQNRTLVFIEVKTIVSRETSVLKPEDNITTYKISKVNRMAQYFVGEHPELINEEMGWRIDLLAIELPEKLQGPEDRKAVIRHYENV
jgi:putative endonuclease